MSVFKLLKQSGSHYKDLPTGMLGADLALKFLLAVFPAVLVGLTLLGVVFAYYGIDLATVIDFVSSTIGTILPQEILSLVVDNLREIVQSSSLNIFSIGFVLLVISAMGLIRSLISHLNLIYEVEESRTWWQKVLLALLLFIAGLVLVVFLVQALFITDGLLQFLTGIGVVAPDTSLPVWRWPFLLVGFFLAVYGSYVFVPNNKKHYWKWNLPGALLFTLGWFVLSWVFNLYVANFANYNATYGVLGAIILLLFYLRLVAQLYIMGAVINSQILHQQERGSLWARLKRLFS